MVCIFIVDKKEDFVFLFMVGIFYYASFFGVEFYVKVGDMFKKG